MDKTIGTKIAEKWESTGRIFAGEDAHAQAVRALAEIIDAELVELVRDAKAWRDQMAAKYGHLERFRNPQTGKIELPDDYHTGGSDF